MTDSINVVGRLGAVAAAALALQGCGLISSDVANFDLKLKDKQFSIDATGWQVDQTQADLLLGTSCTGMTNICEAAAMAACADDCRGACNLTTQKCELALDVSLYRAIDLQMDQPELMSIDSEPVIKVTIDAMTYAVTSNTLNVATPEITIYVAPMSVMDPTDPEAKQIGTIAPVPAMTLVTPPEVLEFTANGRADLVAVMNNFRTPFNLLVGSTLVIQQGMPVPTGKLDASIEITAHAGL